jgi:hypothetical protein
MLFGMIENPVREVHRVAIHEAVRIAGGFAWTDFCARADLPVEQALTTR